MSIFDSINAQPSTPDMLRQLRSNPASVLKQAGLNVPDGMSDPQQIINHLLQSGQVSNPRLQMAQRMMSMMGRR